MEADAFEKAVNYQAEYEKAQDEAMDSLPDSVTGFKIGNFSATMEKRTGKEISPEAYGVLLRAGLLYKGLDGRHGGEDPICTRYALGPHLPPVPLTLEDIRQIWGDTLASSLVF